MINYHSHLIHFFDGLGRYYGDALNGDKKGLELYMYINADWSIEIIIHNQNRNNKKNI